MNKILSRMFRCFAAADDKLAPVGTILVGGALQAAVQLAGNADSAKNILAVFDMPWADSLAGPMRPVWIYTRNAPGTDYANVPMGSLCTAITHTAGAAASAKLWFKTNATTWADVTD